MPVRDSYCSFCGTAFAAGQPWPRRCAACAQVSYRNPLPVAVALLPVADGVLVVRRAIPPGRGLLALPGGFVNVGEAWQQAAVRELAEETGVVAVPADVALLDTLSAPDGTLLVFGLLPPRALAELPASVPNAESDGWQVVTEPVELAFDLHTAVLARYLADR